MLRADMCGWTSQMGTLKINKTKDQNGIEKETKTMYFTLATGRGHKTEYVNGQPVKVQQTDFVFCRAHGTAAQLLNDYCNNKHEGTGKLVSREISVWGHMETYKNTRKVMLEKIIPVKQPDGTTKYFKYQFEGSCPTVEYVFVVSAIQLHGSADHKEPVGMVTSEIPEFTMTEVDAPTNFVDTGVEFQPNNTTNPASGNPAPASSPSNPGNQVRNQVSQTANKALEPNKITTGLSLSDMQPIDSLDGNSDGTLPMPF